MRNAAFGIRNCFRKRTLVALLLVLCLLLTGCHGGGGHAAYSLPHEFDTSREYEIVFWAKTESNATQADIYRKAAADFEALYPNIHVTIKFYTDYGRIYQDVITNIATDSTPNVCITYPDHIATYLQSDNCVVPLDDLIDEVLSVPLVIAAALILYGIAFIWMESRKNSVLFFCGHTARILACFDLCKTFCTSCFNLFYRFEHILCIHSLLPPYFSISLVL